jgi:para-aminobenzoate synthetase component 2
VLVVDNYDSFVFNIVHYLGQLGADCVVRQRDELRISRDTRDVHGVLLSPGPGHPEAAGQCVDVVRHCAQRRQPLLGVCLGHQVIAVAYGALVSRAPELIHGSTSPIHHDGSGLFTGLAHPFAATRYHSLAVDPASVPATLRVTAWTGDGVIMGLRHHLLPLDGVQFHPESILSEGGHQLLANWLSTLREEGAPETEKLPRMV